MTIPGGFIAGDVLTAAEVNALPGGLIGQASITADTSTTTTTADASVSVTFTAQAGRTYKVTAIARITSTVADDLSGVIIADSSNVVQNRGSIVAGGANRAEGINVIALVAPGAGSVTYKIRYTRVSGSGNVKISADSTGPCTLVVEDIGET